MIYFNEIFVKRHHTDTGEPNQINFVYVLLCSFVFLCVLSGLIHVGSDIMAFLELFQGTENSMHSSPVGARRWCEPSHLPLGPGAFESCF